MNAENPINSKINHYEINHYERQFGGYLADLEYGSTEWLAITDSIRETRLRIDRQDSHHAAHAQAVYERENGPNGLRYMQARDEFRDRFVFNDDLATKLVQQRLGSFEELPPREELSPLTAERVLDTLNIWHQEQLDIEIQRRMQAA